MFTYFSFQSNLLRGHLESKFTRYERPIGNAGMGKSMDGTALPVIGGSNPLKGRQESKFVKKSQEYARGTLGTMQTIEARPMHNISAAGMPS